MIGEGRTRETKCLPRSPDTLLRSPLSRPLKSTLVFCFINGPGAVFPRLLRPLRPKRVSSPMPFVEGMFVSYSKWSIRYIKCIQYNAIYSGHSLSVSSRRAVIGRNRWRCVTAVSDDESGRCCHKDEIPLS